MPTKRKKRVRARIQLLPEEREWLTGQPVEGAGKLWRFRQGYPGTIARLQQIIEAYGHLIPEGRLPELERDIEQWTPPRPPRGLASFR